MPNTWTVRLLIAVPVAVIVIFIARTYMRNKSVDYWTLAEDANKPNDRDAQLRLLFVGNSFIHYNGGAEKVTSDVESPYHAINFLVRTATRGVHATGSPSLRPAIALGLQVVAGFLEESLGKSVYARRYCPGGYTWRQHLEDAQDPKRSLYRLLGDGGKKHWDVVIFQVCCCGAAQHVC